MGSTIITTVPDKNHTWEPQKRDWKKIKFFGKKTCRAIKTPEGWLIYILNNGRLQLPELEQVPITHVCTKYIHDPEHISDPDETEKETDIQKTEKKANNQTSIHLDMGNTNITPSGTKEKGPFASYHISIEENVCRGVTSFTTVEVKTLEELKDILKNQFKKSHFTLISTCIVADLSTIHNKRSYIPLAEINEDDLKWLAEKSNIETRHLA